MLRIQNIRTAVLLLCCSAMPSLGAVPTTLPSVFADHMVLQRDMPLPVWGRAEPGAKVTVAVGTERRDATADAAGRWSVQFPPMKAGGPAVAVTVTDSSGPVATFSDVLIGDVWIASGQSNMELALRATDNAEAEIARADEPQIRLFQVKREPAEVPQFSCGGQWQVCSHATAAQFSAVAYYFARDVQKKENVPIGVIGTYAAGTKIESWLSVDGVKVDPSLRRWGDEIRGREASMASLQTDYEQRTVPQWRTRHDDWERDIAPPYRQAMTVWNAAADAAKAKGDRLPPKPKPTQPEPKKPDPPTANPHKIGNLFNAMVAPLMPFAIKGVIWYQGESNADNPAEYRSLFPGLIADWRRQWNQTGPAGSVTHDFPFLFVQLPNFVSYPNADWPGLREAQAQTLGVSPNTNMVVAIDLGNDGDLHPKKKAEIGHRLARVAGHVVYGHEEMPFQGPTFASLIVGDGFADVVVTHVGTGLIVNRPPSPAAFAVAGHDGQFVDAAAKIIAPDKIRLTAQTNGPIVSVRYAWANTPHVNLYNSDGLPAVPFQEGVNPEVAPPAASPEK